MPERSIFIGPRLIGSDTVPFFYRHGQRISPKSHAFFCPVCGEIWARIFIPDTKWYVIHRECSAHGNGWDLRVPGSPELYESFPADVLLILLPHLIEEPDRVY